MGDSSLSIWDLDDSEYNMLSDLVDDVCRDNTRCSACVLYHNLEREGYGYSCLYDEYASAMNRLIHALKKASQKNASND